MRCLILIVAIFIKSIEVEGAASIISSQCNGLQNGNENNEIVKVDLYYECLCPFSISFYRENFIDALKKLGPNLDVHTYPFGNAKVHYNDSNCPAVTCQHGPKECYGNALHGCAMDYFLKEKNMTVLDYVIFNACMMSDERSNRGSDDQAADVCAKQLNVDSEPIKACAKGGQGRMNEILFAIESSKVTYKGVPHVRINGVPANSETFMEDLCKVFKNPPPACQKNN